jgi:hypothetical protein
MKKLVVICIVVLFLFTGYAFSQDCGKCPAKTSCLKAKVKKDKALEKDPVVFIAQADKMFHKVKMKLSQAKEKGYEPCTECFPPEKKEIKNPDPKK